MVVVVPKSTLIGSDLPYPVPRTLTTVPTLPRDGVT